MAQQVVETCQCGGALQLKQIGTFPKGVFIEYKCKKCLKETKIVLEDKNQQSSKSGH